MKMRISLEYWNISRSTTRFVPFLPMFNMLDGVPVSQPSSTQSQSSCIISFFRFVCSLAFIHPASLFLKKNHSPPHIMFKGTDRATKSEEFLGEIQTAFDPPFILCCNFPDFQNSRDRDHSERRGVGVNGRLEPFQKFVGHGFGTLTRPLDCYDY